MQRLYYINKREKPEYINLANIGSWYSSTKVFSSDFSHILDMFFSQGYNSDQVLL